MQLAHDATWRALRTITAHMLTRHTGALQCFSLGAGPGDYGPLKMKVSAPPASALAYDIPY